MRLLGLILFSVLFLGVLGLVVAVVLFCLQKAASSGGMQSVAVGFGLFGVAVPLAALLAIPICFLVVFLAFKKKRR